jgi:tol-pal system protein YbgF
MAKPKTRDPEVSRKPGTSIRETEVLRDAKSGNKVSVVVESEDLEADYPSHLKFNDRLVVSNPQINLLGGKTTTAGDFLVVGTLAGEFHGGTICGDFARTVFIIHATAKGKYTFHDIEGVHCEVHDIRFIEKKGQTTGIEVWIDPLPGRPGRRWTYTPKAGLTEQLVEHRPKNLGWSQLKAKFAGKGAESVIEPVELFDFTPLAHVLHATAERDRTIYDHSIGNIVRAEENMVVVETSKERASPGVGLLLAVDFGSKSVFVASRGSDDTPAEFSPSPARWPARLQAALREWIVSSPNGAFDALLLDLPRSDPVSKSNAQPTLSPRQQFDAAMDLLGRLQYVKAKSALESFVAANPEEALSGSAQFWVGEIAYAQKDYKTAVAAYADVMERFPTTAKAADSMLKLGLSLLGLKKNPEGCILLGALKSRFPDAPRQILDQAADVHARQACTTE